MMLSTSAIAVDGSVPVVTGICRDLSEQKRFEAQLAHQALHDPLTGLPNRMMLTDRLGQALARVRRSSRMCGVLFVDLDRFKTVNDTLGHAVGDRLLIEAAARIQAAVRETDTVARLGGDEFVVLCEDIEGVHHVTDFAGRIIASLQKPFHLGDDDLHVSASIGIAFSAGGNETADVILANADIAMYRAKDNGRSCYELFDEAMQQWITTQVALEAALRQAVPRDELRLFCQPVVEADSAVDTRLRGARALGTTRLRPRRPRQLHPHGGRDGPDRRHRVLGARPSLRPRRRLGAPLAGTPPAHLRQRLESPAAHRRHRRHRHVRARAHRARPGAAHAGAHRERAHRRRGQRRAAVCASSAPSASTSRSTTSVPATRHSPICARSRSTS